MYLNMEINVIFLLLIVYVLNEPFFFLLFLPSIFLPAIFSRHFSSRHFSSRHFSPPLFSPPLFSPRHFPRQFFPPVLPASSSLYICSVGLHCHCTSLDS